VWFAHRPWLRSEAGTATDAWVEVGERVEGDEGDTTWLAEFLSAGPRQAEVALWFKQDVLGRTAWKNILRNSADIVSGLQGHGFVCDASDGSLTIPITLSADALATAFEEKDFTAAFAPLTAALTGVIGATGLLDQLVEAVRTQAA
jgi:hypothetical protein